MDADLTSEEGAEEEVEQEQVEVSESELIEDVLQDETPKKREVDPKDAVIGGFRRDLRDQRADNQSLRQRLDEQDKVIADLKQTSEPAEKSPIEKLAAEDPLATPDAGTHAAERQFNARQRAAEAKSAAEATTKAATVKSDQDRNQAIAEGQLATAETFSVEKVGQGVDFESVVTAGEKYLTEGEKLDIRTAAPDKVWELAYHTCRRAILAKGGAEAKLLQEREAAHAKLAKAKPKGNEETPGEEQHEEVPAPEGEFSHITSFLGDGDNAE